MGVKIGTPNALPGSQAVFPVLPHVSSCQALTPHYLRSLKQESVPRSLAEQLTFCRWSCLPGLLGPRALQTSSHTHVFSEPCSTLAPMALLWVCKRRSVALNSNVFSVAGSTSPFLACRGHPRWVEVCQSGYRVAWRSSCCPAPPKVRDPFIRALCGVSQGENSNTSEAC